jgi:hypothetical protein
VHEYARGDESSLNSRARVQRVAADDVRQTRLRDCSGLRWDRARRGAHRSLTELRRAAGIALEPRRDLVRRRLRVPACVEERPGSGHAEPRHVVAQAEKGMVSEVRGTAGGACTHSQLRNSKQFGAYKHTSK